jgi:hypothetical protein
LTLSPGPIIPRPFVDLTLVIDAIGEWIGLG